MKAAHYITQLLQAWQDGDRDSGEELMRIIRPELECLARKHLRKEYRKNHTLETGGLIDEAYIRLVNQHAVWQNRAQFFAVASQLMRWILTDYAKDRAAAKRGGKNENLPLEAAENSCGKNMSLDDLIDLDEVLTRLEKVNKLHAKIVEYRFYAGLSIEETAAMLKIPEYTVSNGWRTAKAWLLKELTRKSDGNPKDDSAH